MTTITVKLIYAPNKNTKFFLLHSPTSVTTTLQLFHKKQTLQEIQLEQSYNKHKIAWKNQYPFSKWNWTPHSVNTVPSQGSYWQFHFRHLPEGRGFTIFTDHKPLTYALHVNTKKYTPRDTRQLDYILQFTSDIRFIKGSDNIVTDTLSSSTIQSIDSVDLTFELIADEQRKDATLDKFNDTSLQLKEQYFAMSK